MEQLLFDTNNNLKIIGKIEKTLMRIREFEPKEDDRYIKEVLKEKLCRYCEWRECDGETEEICPV